MSQFRVVFEDRSPVICGLHSVDELAYLTPIPQRVDAQPRSAQSRKLPRFEWQQLRCQLYTPAYSKADGLVTATRNTIAEVSSDRAKSAPIRATFTLRRRLWLTQKREFIHVCQPFKWEGQLYKLARPTTYQAAIEAGRHGSSVANLVG